MTASRCEVAGYELAVDVSGAGSTSVVFVSGLGDGGETWREVVAALRVSAGPDEIRTITYDRAGIGASDPQPGPAPRTYGSAADELHDLLLALDVRPCVVVGHSIGGLIALLLARQHPGLVAGLVLVDSADHELFLDVDQPQLFLPDGDGPRAARFDVRASNDELAAGPLPTGRPAAVVACRPGRWLEITEPERYRPFGVAELDARWQEYQRRTAETIGGHHLVAAVGGHYVQLDQPPLVVDAVAQIVAAVRSPTHLG
jgi:pimeloyl-ACP methyl ester carboxylesterase